MSRADRPSPKYAPLFDVDPVTGRSIEVFYADRALETFGRIGAGWFWWPRQRGLAPTGPAAGPFPSSYAAYRHAAISAAVTSKRSAVTASVQAGALCRKDLAMLPYCFRQSCAWKQQAFEDSEKLVCSAGCWRARRDSNS